MTATNVSHDRMELDGFTRFIHLGLMVFGLLALMTGFLAEDYKHPQHMGFSFHRWFGMGLAAFVALRLWHGFFGPSGSEVSGVGPLYQGTSLIHCGRYKDPIKFPAPG